MYTPRVLLLTDADVFAGTERHFLDLAIALRDLSVDVSVACPASAPLAIRAMAAGIQFIPIAKRGAIDFAAVRTLKDLLHSERIDLIHAHNGRTHLAAAMAVARAGRGVCVATQHFLSPTRTSRRGLKAWISRRIHSYTSRRTAHIIAISQAVKNAMLTRNDFDPSRITVVPNGLQCVVEPETTLPLRDHAMLRAELGLPGDARLVFSAARLQAEKGLPDLVDAFTIVRQRFPNSICLIAGEGDLRPDLEQLIIARGLSSAVRLLGFRDDVPKLMKAADLFVLPSPAEPFGLVLLEAMAHSLPVVACNAGGPAEILVHNQSGLLVEPRNPPALAAALCALLSRPEWAAELGRAGRARFEQHYTADRMAAATIKVYESALGATGNSFARVPALSQNNG